MDGKTVAVVSLYGTCSVLLSVSGLIVMMVRAVLLSGPPVAGGSLCSAP